MSAKDFVPMLVQTCVVVCFHDVRATCLGLGLVEFRFPVLPISRRVFIVFCPCQWCSTFAVLVLFSKCSASVLLEVLCFPVSSRQMCFFVFDGFSLEFHDSVATLQFKPRIFRSVVHHAL